MAAWLGQAQAANLYSDKQSAVDASRSARDLLQLISLPLRVTKPVSANLTFLADRGASRLFFWWLSSTAGYVPGNEAQISLSDIAHHQRVLSNGCYPFLSGRSENLSVFLASLSASTKGVIAITNRSVLALNQGVTTLVAVPSLVSKTVTFATGRVIPKRNFLVKVFCVLFSKKVFSVPKKVRSHWVLLKFPVLE